MVSFFKTPDDLGSRATAAIALCAEINRDRHASLAQGWNRRDLSGMPIVGLRFADVGGIFRDRDVELPQLRGLLSDPTAKLICIIGQGGTGKTLLLSRLCAEVESGEVRLPGTSEGAGADGIVYLSCRMKGEPTVEQLFHAFCLMIGIPDDDELMKTLRDATVSLTQKMQFLLGRLRRDRTSSRSTNWRVHWPTMARLRTPTCGSSSTSA